MLKIIKLLQRFTKISDSGSGVQQSKQLNEELKIHTFYQHIVDLPLYNFIQCDVNENLSALIITGFPSQDELKAAWLNIQQETADSGGNSEHILYRELYKEVAILLLDIEACEKIISLLWNVNSLYFQTELNELLSSDYKFDWDDRKAYEKELSRAANKVKALRNINYTLKKDQLDVMNQKNSTGEKVTIEYWYNILYTLEDHAGYKLGDKISVHEFFVRLKRYNDHCEKSKSKK